MHFRRRWHTVLVTSSSGTIFCRALPTAKILLVAGNANILHVLASHCGACRGYASRGLFLIGGLFYITFPIRPRCDVCRNNLGGPMGHLILTTSAGGAAGEPIDTQVAVALVRFCPSPQNRPRRRYRMCATSTSHLPYALSKDASNVCAAWLIFSNWLSPEAPI